MAASNVLKVQALWRAFDNGGLDAVLRLADADVEWIPAGAAGRHFQGHDGLREFMAHRDDAGPVRAEPLSYFDYGRRVLVYGRLQEERVFWLYTFNEQRLTRFEAFRDHHAAVEAALA
jgi:ketosteroid isomerase-like protein